MIKRGWAWLAVASALFACACATDVEVERTRLPNVDPPAKTAPTI